MAVALNGIKKKMIEWVCKMTVCLCLCVFYTKGLASLYCTVQSNQVKCTPQDYIILMNLLFEY